MVLLAVGAVRADLSNACAAHADIAGIAAVNPALFGGHLEATGQQGLSALHAEYCTAKCGPTRGYIIVS